MKRRLKAARSVRINSFIKSNWCILALTCVFFIGIVFGACANFNADENARALLSQYAQNLDNPRSGTATLLYGITVCFSFFLATYLCGLSVPGFIIVFCLPFLKGYSFGFSSAFLYSVFGAKGILICAAGPVPSSLIFAAALILASRTAANCSLRLLDCLRGRRDDAPDLRRYTLLCTLLFAASLTTVLFDAFITPNMIKLFVK